MNFKNSQSVLSSIQDIRMRRKLLGVKEKLIKIRTTETKERGNVNGGAGEQSQYI